MYLLIREGGRGFQTSLRGGCSTTWDVPSSQCCSRETRSGKGGGCHYGFESNLLLMVTEPAASCSVWCRAWGKKEIRDAFFIFLMCRQRPPRGRCRFVGTGATVVLCRLPLRRNRGSLAMAVCSSGAGNDFMSIIRYWKWIRPYGRLFDQAQCFLSVLKKCVCDVAIFKM